jgi:hypothetical protein
MFNSLLNVFFGCSHKRTTFPITPSRRSQLSGDSRRGTYVACLDCGKEFDYSWKEMRVSKAHVAPSHPRPLSVVNH